MSTRNTRRELGQSWLDSDTPVELFSQGALLLDERSWDVGQEFAGATENEIRRAAAVSTGGEHLLIHHGRSGTVQFRGLLVSMARLLCDDDGLEDLTGEQRDAAYDHLAGHYRELGIQPPEPGSIDDQRAYELALEGRLALLDAAGDAFVFVEPVEDEGRFVAGFCAVDNSELRTFEPPKHGPYTDHRHWGQFAMVAAPYARAAAASPQRRSAAPGMNRVGMEFSRKNRDLINRAADDLETRIRGMQGHCRNAMGTVGDLRDLVAIDDAGDQGSPQDWDGSAIN